MTQLLFPRSLAELWETWAQHPQGRIFAGGTDLFVKLRSQAGRPAALIGLERVAELREVRADGETLRIGAAAPVGHLTQHEIIRQDFPALRDALTSIGGPALRNMATLGGNVCTASPAGDTLPPLYVLGARMVVRSAAGERIVPIEKFILAPGRTALQEKEVLVAVLIEQPPQNALQLFTKVGQRRAHAIAIASLAVCATPGLEGRCAVRCAWGSVGPTVVCSPAVDRLLTENPLNEATVAQAAQAAREAVAPINDIRASAEYRRTVAGHLLYRLLEKQ